MSGSYPHRFDLDDNGQEEGTQEGALHPRLDWEVTVTQRGTGWLVQLHYSGKVTPLARETAKYRAQEVADRFRATRCPDHFIGAEQLVCLTCGSGWTP